jgi:hypothetical protein
MPGANGRPLRKTLTYKDQGGGDLVHHTQGWLGFEWQAGPVQVLSVGDWGKVKVYAASEAEGQRVIRHAAQLAGYDLDGDRGHQWIVGQHSGGRIGRTGRMVVRNLGSGVAVRMRDGSDGRSEYIDLLGLG